MEDPARWDEEDTRTFLNFADVVVPDRREQYRTITSLIPAEKDEWFLCVDLACGAGDLSKAILEAYPQAQMTLLDGSEGMLSQAAENLAEYSYQIDLRRFDLLETDWLDDLPRRNRCIVSSLAIHHLEDQGKRNLFERLYDQLDTGGALLIADLVAPANALAQELYGDEWDRATMEQSLAVTGSLAAYEEFQNGWNHYRTPDVRFDKPSRLFDQLRWLVDVGFQEVDCFWLKAGHAVYGGYKR
jgi:tRNA (cmo5U34)-methyltransferase